MGDAAHADREAAGDALARRVSVEEHREHLLGRTAPLQPIELRIGDALGLVLAEDVHAEDPLPPFATASTGGYAVAAATITAASPEEPVELEVGDPGTELTGGRAMRIAGGARIPDGADCVLDEARLELRGSRLAVRGPVAPGTNVRAEGRDLRAGQRVVRAGRRIRPGDIAVLAALGRVRVRCHPAPRVVVLVAGDELVDAEGTVAPGSLRDSNGPMLSALLRQAGTVTFRTGIVGEDRRSLIDAFDSNLGHADVFVAVGGGTQVVRQVLEMLGEVIVAEVAMEPGTRQMIGAVRGVPVFVLPGHPAAAFVSYEVFVRPGLRRLQGRSDLHRPRISARLDHDVETTLGARSYLSVRLSKEGGRWVAGLTGEQDPYDLASLAAADGLAEVPASSGSVAAGSEVPVHLLIEP